jgi:hypothetical protein
MTVTTHIAASCLLTAYTLKTGMGEGEKVLVLSLGSLLLHYLLDLVPHGFIATPWTLFKKFIPTVLEFAPGPVILLTAILHFGHPGYFILAAGFGLIPDFCTVLLWKHRHSGRRPFLVWYIHALHRKVHWFEAEDDQGRVLHRFPNTALLILEACLAAVLVAVLLSSGTIAYGDGS